MGKINLMTHHFSLYLRLHICLEVPFVLHSSCLLLQCCPRMIFNVVATKAVHLFQSRRNKDILMHILLPILTSKKRSKIGTLSLPFPSSMLLSSLLMNTGHLTTPLKSLFVWLHCRSKRFRT